MTPDVGTFLARLTRLDPGAVVRVRRVATVDRRALWALVPWNVLVTRTVEASTVVGDDDVTVSAAEWLRRPDDDLAALPRHDGRWRMPLPAPGGVIIETLPTYEVRRLGVAAAATLRETVDGGLRGRAVGARVVRDALLDHIPIVVTSGERRIDVPQRIVQAVLQMGFLSDDSADIHIVQNGAWIGIAAAYGTAWWREQSALAVRPRHG